MRSHAEHARHYPQPTHTQQWHLFQECLVHLTLPDSIPHNDVPVRVPVQCPQLARRPRLCREICNNHCAALATEPETKLQSSSFCVIFFKVNLGAPPYLDGGSTRSTVDECKLAKRSVLANSRHHHRSLVVLANPHLHRPLFDHVKVVAFVTCAKHTKCLSDVRCQLTVHSLIRPHMYQAIHINQPVCAFAYPE